MRFLLMFALSLSLMFTAVPSFAEATKEQKVSELQELLKKADTSWEKLEKGTKDSAAAIEKEWRDLEAKIEGDRTQIIAIEANVPVEDVVTWREKGLGWDAITTYYDLPATVILYGSSPNDPKRINKK